MNNFFADAQNTIKQLFSPQIQTNSSPIEGDATSKVINEIKKLSSQNYSNSIMLRGLNLARISATDWYKFYPYKFIILEAIQDNEGKISYRKYNGLEVVLPISPQSLTITTHFASQLHIGSQSVLEEHNGINVKHISFTATTGIFLKRKVYEITPKSDKSILDNTTFFGGTVAAALNFQRTLETVFPKQKPTPQETEESEAIFSGYYQYHLIRAFLELYAELKKTPQGRGYRLGLELGKDRVIYIVTPQAFNTQKSASSPMEITYSFTGIAWATVAESNLLSGQNALSNFLINRPNEMQEVLNKIRQIRSVIQSAKNIISAFKADVDVTIIGPMNNIILAMKELFSIEKTLADLPKDLAKSFNDLILRELSTLPASNFNTEVSVTLTSLGFEKINDNDNDNPFNESVFESFYDDFSLSSLTITSEQQTAIDEATFNALNTTNNNIENLINNLDELSNSLEPITLSQGPDSPFWEILNAVYELKSHLYSLLAQNFFGDVSVNEQAAGINRLLDFYQGYAAAGGITFNKYKSKFAIPFPFRTSLEWLAQRYLGDATKWIEIAAINNLQHPYVDEDGFIRPFLTNGTGRQFNIASAENLFVGQDVWLMADNIPMQKRKIKAIQKVTDTNFVIVVDGEANLDSFLISQNAKMKAYLPYTVNSQKLIYIPIDETPGFEQVETKSLAFIDESKEMLQLAKVDFLLDQNGDLAISQDGYLNLSYGKNNIIQAARLKLQTIAGELLLHPEYGAGVKVGDSMADVSLTNLMNSIKDSFASDPRFTEVKSIEVSKDNGTLKIRVYVVAASNAGLVPLEFDITA